MGPLLTREPFPLDLGHELTTEYQSAELIDQTALLLRIVVGKILLQLAEKRALSVGLTLEAKPHKGSDRLTHAHVGLLGITLHSTNKARIQPNGLARCACF